MIYFDYRVFRLLDAVWTVWVVQSKGGYPPFFAPSRNAILGRIHRGEVSFDPPFWSKISEEVPLKIALGPYMHFLGRGSLHSVMLAVGSHSRHGIGGEELRVQLLATILLGSLQPSGRRCGAVGVTARP